MPHRQFIGQCNFVTGDLHRHSGGRQPSSKRGDGVLPGACDDCELRPGHAIAEMCLPQHFGDFLGLRRAVRHQAYPDRVVRPRVNSARVVDATMRKAPGH